MLLSSIAAARLGIFVGVGAAVAWSWYNYQYAAQKKEEAGFNYTLSKQDRDLTVKERAIKLGLERDTLFDIIKVPGVAKQNIDDPIGYMELLRTAQTGDIICWSSDHPTSKSIRYLTQSAFSHVTMVVRGNVGKFGIQNDNTLHLYHSTGASFYEIINGVQQPKKVTLKVTLTPLEEHVRVYYKEHGAVGVYFKLNRSANKDKKFSTKILDEKMKKFALKNMGKEYNTATQEWLQHIGFDINVEDFIRQRFFDLPNSDETRNTFICTDLIVCAYMMCGILPPKPRSMTYMPGSFCQEQCIYGWEYTSGFFPIVNKHILPKKVYLDTGRFIIPQHM